MNSIMIPAVTVNQIAAKTGAVVRNFFMGVLRVENRGKGRLNRRFSGVKR